MKLILLGAPGAGKGTQAEVLSEHYQIPAISTGAIIRNAIRSGTEFGKLAKTYIDDGNLVPDEVVIALVKERLGEADCANGFILDGFPRTVPQAKALDALYDIDSVLSIEVEDQAIIERLSGRRECAVCRATYHVVYNPTAKEGICDKCGGALIMRDDDRPDTIVKRLAVYHQQTEPLKEYYTKTGKLTRVNGQEEIADTTAAMFRALEGLK
ncbi:MAG: adenylate kinase [Ruminococcaceae bacterium]|nr:adenylate kinase [Oscillospiraceae bacterium]